VWSVTNELVFAIGASFGCGVGGFGLAAPVLAFINADIGPDVNLSWVALSYLLTNSIGLMLVGRLSDLFGATIQYSAMRTYTDLVRSTVVLHWR
jgi:MFS family permease